MNCDKLPIIIHIAMLYCDVHYDGQLAYHNTARFCCFALQAIWFRVREKPLKLSLSQTLLITSYHRYRTKARNKKKDVEKSANALSGTGWCRQNPRGHEKKNEDTVSHPTGERQTPFSIWVTYML